MTDPLSSIWVGFVVAIAIVGLGGAASALHHTRRYNRTETRELVHVADKLRRMLETAAATSAGPAPAEPRPRRLIAPTELLEGLPPNSIVADRLALIQRMRELQVKVNVSALQHLTLAREASAKWLTVPGFTANLTMMLGLLGTVVGLSLMVQHIGLGLPQDRNQITLDSWMASIDQIRAVLDGMRTGFAATIAGVGAAIVLSWLNHRLSRAQATFLNRLDRFTTEELLPATLPGSEDESLLEKVSGQLENSFARLDEVTRTNQETLRELGAIEKGFIDIVEAVRQTTKSETSERLLDLLGRVSGVIDQLATLNGSIVNVTGVIDRSRQASVDRIDRLLRDQDRQRAIRHWPLPALAFAFLAAVNILLLWSIVRH